VCPAPTPPAGLAYTDPAAYTVNVAIANLDRNGGFTAGTVPVAPRVYPGPAVHAAVPVFTVAPALPTGLAISGANGQISGTPTAVAVRAPYTVTAITGAGQVSAVVHIEVKGTLMTTYGVPA